MRKLRVIVATFVIIGLVFVFLLFSALLGINTRGRLMVCENTLKAVAHSIELYRADFNGVLPPSLLELKPYIEKRYLHGVQGLPRCVGNRNEKEGSDTWEYVYEPSLRNIAVRPICWDSEPHRIKLLFRPDLLRWNILYSDGHIETLNHTKFFKELLRFVSRKPDVLAKMELPSGRKRGTLPTFLIGLLVGIGVTYLTLRLKKKASSRGKSRAT